jgi:hypothetical protein
MKKTKNNTLVKYYILKEEVKKPVMKLHLNHQNPPKKNSLINDHVVRLLRGKYIVHFVRLSAAIIMVVIILFTQFHSLSIQPTRAFGLSFSLVW